MKFDAVVFLDVEDVHAIHRGVLADFGGSEGIHDIGLVVSATMGPRSGYHRSLAAMAEAYAYAFAKNHGYSDANKRTAAVVLRVFLWVNKLHVVLTPEWEFYMEAVAAGAMSRDELLAEIIKLMGGDPVLLDEE